MIIAALKEEVRELKMSARLCSPQPIDDDEPEARDDSVLEDQQRDVRHDDGIICVQSSPDFETSCKGVTRKVINAR